MGMSKVGSVPIGKVSYQRGPAGAQSHRTSAIALPRPLIHVSSHETHQALNPLGSVISPHLNEGISKSKQSSLIGTSKSQGLAQKVVTSI